MSYKIVKQTVQGQRRETVANGFLNYITALDRAAELGSESNEESRGFEPQTEFIVEEE